MGLFDFLTKSKIDHGLAEYAQTPDALLVDVRSPQEYQQGHIPGSKNIPLQHLDKVDKMIKNYNTPLFVYCHSGARSTQATAALKRMGYTLVHNIGGISSYTGKVEL